MPVHADEPSRISAREPTFGSSSPPYTSFRRQGAALKSAEVLCISGDFSSTFAASYDIDQSHSWQAAAAAPLAESMPGLDTNVWDQLKNTVAPTYPRLANNISADVVVVGGGIAGLSIAYDLVRAGETYLLRARLMRALLHFFISIK